MVREEIKTLTAASPRELRKFGLTVGGVFLLLGLWFAMRAKPWHLWFSMPGALLICAGFVLPRSLKWLYVFWMGLALILGTIVSTALLIVMFYLIVTPIGLTARLAGRDFLSLKLNIASPTYWIRRDVTPKQKHEHERQF